MGGKEKKKVNEVMPWDEKRENKTKEKEENE